MALHDDLKLAKTTVLDGGSGREEATVMNFVNQIFREALKERATDISRGAAGARPAASATASTASCRECRCATEYEACFAGLLIPASKIMAHLDIAERRLAAGTGRINLELGQGPQPTPCAPAACIPSRELGAGRGLRLLSRQKFDFEKLGFHPCTSRRRLRRLLGAPNGIILVTGPTGSEVRAPRSTPSSASSIRWTAASSPSRTRWKTSWTAWCRSP